ncbi:MAG TPA: Na+/H+ antiporter NhaA, partial [Ferruginibacter sp.]|nr:Na+/H+ antiporter NhaA [Ferruginibacter sp.]
KPVAFFIIPVFVLANTAIAINGSFSHLFNFNYSVGIAMGLLMGKPIGILLFSFLAVKLGASQLPDYLNWKHILGAGLLGGIGFTMSIFICLLAFNESEVINNAKLAILVSSFIAGVLGYLILRLILKKNATD